MIATTGGKRRLKKVPVRQNYFVDKELPPSPPLLAYQLMKVVRQWPKGV
jgi:hypothetical protein